MAFALDVKTKGSEWVIKNVWLEEPHLEVPLEDKLVSIGLDSDGADDSPINKFNNHTGSCENPEVRL